VSRVADHREAARRSLIQAARTHLTRGDDLSPLVIDDICKQVGIHPKAFGAIYESQSALFDDIHAALIEECRVRLVGAVDTFQPTGSAGDLRGIAVAVANARPLTRAGFLFRLGRRQRALTREGEGLSIAASERLFTMAVADIVTALVGRLDRQLIWRPSLATRIILDTYERSFEAWLLDGHDEEDFVDSTYIGWTLPELLERMSATRA